MAMTTAAGLGVIAAAVIPFVAVHAGVDLAGLLSGDLVRIPVLRWSFHWSWPVFALVTLIAWASLKAAEDR